MRRRFGADLEVETHAPAFREVMKSGGVRTILGYESTRAKLRAQAVSGLKFGSGVDTDAIKARGWVGASCIDARTGRMNAGLHAKQVEALSQALHGV